MRVPAGGSAVDHYDVLRPAFLRVVHFHFQVPHEALTIQLAIGGRELFLMPLPLHTLPTVVGLMRELMRPVERLTVRLDNAGAVSLSVQPYVTYEGFAHERALRVDP